MSDYYEISDDGENWKRVKTIPSPRPDFIRSGTTNPVETDPKPPMATLEPPVEVAAPVIGACAVCGEPIRESDARIETEAGALAHPAHDLSPTEQDALDAA